MRSQLGGGQPLAETVACPPAPGSPQTVPGPALIQRAVRAG